MNTTSKQKQIWAHRKQRCASILTGQKNSYICIADSDFVKQNSGFCKIINCNNRIEF